MSCPECQGPHSNVTDSRASKSLTRSALYGNSVGLGPLREVLRTISIGDIPCVRRRRECNHCGVRFTSVELSVPVLAELLKRGADAGHEAV